MAERESLIRLAVFGKPVSHSLSPLIHRQFARQFGLAIDYRAVECSPAEFEQRVRDLALAGGRGCNVTVPLKNAAWKLAGQCSPEAEQAQAANTLIMESPAEIYADNTDGRGLVADLRQRLAQDLAGKRILVVGAGGAAAGILADLLQQGPAEVVLANRTPERAWAMARHFAALGRVSSHALDSLEKLEPFDLVINATSLGLSGLAPPLNASLFAPDGLCYDLNYGAAAGPLRRHCEYLGVQYRDGLGMLVAQAAISFYLWTGCEPDSDQVLQALRKDH